MSESKQTPLEIPSVISFDAYQTLTAVKAQYQDAADPEVILRNGLIEESEEIFSTPTDNLDELHKEIGDVTWYLSEVARYKGLSLKDIAGAETFDDFQDADHPEALPVFDPDDVRLNVETNPTNALAVRMMRVVDVMNPKTDGLWHGYDNRPELKMVLRDALNCVAQIATSNDIRLNEAATRSLHKIHNRTRNPHVVDKGQDLKASGRERLIKDPWVFRLLVDAYVDQQSTDH